MSGFRIAIVAASDHPIAEPFAGGLEAQVWNLTVGLKRLGHRITVFAGPGSDRELGVEMLDLRRPHLSEAARRDMSMSAPDWMDAHHAYLDLMLRLGAGRFGEFDLVHNHSLHYLPIAMAPALSMPLLTTLHTPPTPWLESAIEAGGGRNLSFVAVSAATARAWPHLPTPVEVVHNGIDLDRWKPGPGGRSPVWFGRIAPEKGTDLAIEAARLAGRGLNIAGPIADADFFRREIRPRLRRSPEIRYLGHLRQRELAYLVGRSSVALVTPRWEEPYGLVIAEALACGTPVCAFDRGAVREVAGPDCSVIVAGDDVVALAAAIEEAGRLVRLAARHHAEAACGLRTMISRYETLYGRLSASAGLAAPA